MNDIKSWRIYLIQQRMGERGWSKAEFARRTGLSKSNVGRILSGQVDGMTERVKRLICLHLDITEDEWAGLRLSREDAEQKLSHDASSLALWLDRRPQQDRELVFSVARRCGWPD